jgi:hypothetical protein
MWSRMDQLDPVGPPEVSRGRGVLAMPTWTPQLSSRLVAAASTWEPTWF